MSTKPNWPDGYAKIVLDQTDSTMTEARRRASELTGPTWIMAHNQTAAHGRRGRAWANPPGNFAGTLFLRPDETPGNAALRSFVAAVALFSTLSDWVDPDRLSLKWPNDVLLNGGKVAGILLESAGTGGRVEWLAIGVGVNLVSAPDARELETGAVPPVAVADNLDMPVTAAEFLTRLAHHYAAFERQFVTYGFEPIRQAWLVRAAKLGEVITARTGVEETIGTFETVDAEGNLILSTGAGRRAITTAEVFF